MNQELRDSMNRMFTSMLGISYDEFERLDTEIQQQMIADYHKKHPRKKSNEEIVMIGSGENALFLKVKKGKRYMVTSGDESIFVRAGETAKEQMERVNMALDRIAKETPVEKAKQFIKRIGRK